MTALLNRDTDPLDAPDGATPTGDDDADGRLAPLLFVSVIAASAAAAAVLGKMIFGDTGALVGAVIYVVASTAACIVMTIRDADATRPTVSTPDSEVR